MRTVELMGALTGLKGRKVEVETMEGVVRTGVLTEIQTRGIRIGADSEGQIPTAIVLDADRSDPIGFPSVKRISGVRAATPPKAADKGKGEAAE